VRDKILGPGDYDSRLTTHDSRLLYRDLRFVGQVAGTVLVCERPGAVVFIDQHAAHERVNFHRLWKDLEAGRIASESLMFPEVVPLEPSDRARLDDARAALERLGFDLEPYSGDAVAVRRVPAILRGRAVAEVVRDSLAASGDEAEATGTGRLHKIVATVACHASIRAGDAMDAAGVRALLAAMDEIDLAAYCPHGRQAVVVHPLPVVLRWFGR
jgi:DNA mismatch repair protein MutL